MGVHHFRNKRWYDLGKVWGWGDEMIILSPTFSLKTYNQQFSKFMRQVRKIDRDPLDFNKKLDYFGMYSLQQFILRG